MEWMPIESAPKDGTEFLAYDSVTRKQDVCTMSEWRGAREVLPVQQDGEWGPGSGEFGGGDIGEHTNWEWLDSKITHWMPLPEPPKA